MQIDCTNISVRFNSYNWPHLGHPLHRSPVHLGFGVPGSWLILRFLLQSRLMMDMYGLPEWNGPGLSPLLASLSTVLKSVSLKTVLQTDSFNLKKKKKTTNNNNKNTLM